MNNDNKTPIVIGSGCVAQVFKGKVNNKSVAIKVIHPSIKEEIEADIRIMKFVTWIIDIIPGLHNLSLSESVEEFQQIMMAQLDLTKEAKNLQLFRKNFSQLRSFPENQAKGVTFPEPIYPYIASNVLIESFEQGILVSDMLDNSDPITKKKLAMLGLDAILKMTFLDNFIHADLHPGNLIIRYLDNGNLELSMIDVGIVAELLPEDRKNFIELFDAVIRNDGKRVGKLMIERSRGKTCLDKEGFMKELDEVVAEVHACGLSLGRIGIGPLLQKVLVACYKYGVKIESRFAIVIIALGISEGLGRRLDPDVDILKRAAPFVIKGALSHMLQYN
jgi:aarF domain-containing kinase